MNTVDGIKSQLTLLSRIIDERTIIEKYMTPPLDRLKEDEAQLRAQVLQTMIAVGVERVSGSGLQAVEVRTLASTIHNESMLQGFLMQSGNFERVAKLVTIYDDKALKEIFRTNRDEGSTFEIPGVVFEDRISLRINRD